MRKDEIWRIIKEQLYIEIPFKETIFDLIERNLNRIEFVKDHIGLQDFLFLAEKGNYYKDDVFLISNAQVNKENTLEENEKEALVVYEMHPFMIISKLKDFFSQTNRVLAIGIGFKNTEPTKEEFSSIEFSFKMGLIYSKLDVYREIRIKKFPRWYRDSALLPIEFNKKYITYSISKKELSKEELFEKIDESITNQNEKEFLKYSKQLKELSN